MNEEDNILVYNDQESRQKAKQYKIISELGEDDKVLQILEDASDLTKLTRKLAQYILKEKTIDLKDATSDALFKSYHFILSKKIIENNKLKDEFFDSQEEDIKAFREALFRAALQLKSLEITYEVAVGYDIDINQKQSIVDAIVNELFTQIKDLEGVKSKKITFIGKGYRVNSPDQNKQRIACNPDVLKFIFTRKDGVYDTVEKKIPFTHHFSSFFLNGDERLLKKFNYIGDIRKGLIEKLQKSEITQFKGKDDEQIMGELANYEVEVSAEKFIFVKGSKFRLYSEEAVENLLNMQDSVPDSNEELVKALFNSLLLKSKNNNDIELVKLYYNPLQKLGIIDVKIIPRTEKKLGSVRIKLNSNFLKNKDLSDSAVNFLNNLNTEIKTFLKEKQINTSEGFGNTDPKIKPAADVLAQNFAKLISDGNKDEAIKIEIDDTVDGHPFTKNNIDALSGHVLSIQDNKIKFSNDFFSNQRLPKALKDFKKSLKAELKKVKLKFDNLKQYQFEIEGFTCHSALPNDEVQLKEIDDFLKVLIFAVNQPNEVKLGEIIAKEIGEKFNLLDSDFVYSDFQKWMLDWFKKKEGHFRERKDGEEFFKEAEGKIAKLVSIGPTSLYHKKIEAACGITFNPDKISNGLKTFLKPDRISIRQIFNLIVEDTTLGAIEVNAALKVIDKYSKDLQGHKVFIEDSHIFLNLKNLLILEERILHAFESKTSNLLIIECKPTKEKDKEKKLYDKLKDIINHNNEKKIVLITKSSDNLDGKFEKYFSKDKKEDRGYKSEGDFSKDNKYKKEDRGYKSSDFNFDVKELLEKKLGTDILKSLEINHSINTPQEGQETNDKLISLEVLSRLINIKNKIDKDYQVLAFYSLFPKDEKIKVVGENKLSSKEKFGDITLPIDRIFAQYLAANLIVDILQKGKDHHKYNALHKFLLAEVFKGSNREIYEFLENRIAKENDDTLKSEWEEIKDCDLSRLLRSVPFPVKSPSSSIEKDTAQLKEIEKKIKEECELKYPSWSHTYLEENQDLIKKLFKIFIEVDDVEELKSTLKLLLDVNADKVNNKLFTRNVKNIISQNINQAVIHYTQGLSSQRIPKPETFSNSIKILFLLGEVGLKVINADESFLILDPVGDFEHDLSINYKNEIISLINWRVKQGENLDEVDFSKECIRVHEEIIKKYEEEIAKLDEIKKEYQLLLDCLRSKKRRNIGYCQFSWKDIDEFNREKKHSRDKTKIEIDSDKFIDYIKDESISENKRTQLIQLAEQVTVTGKSQGLVSKLISNQKFIKHLSKVGMISGMTMQGMMAKNVLADAVNGNYQGLAINLGFIALPFGVKAGENAALEGLHSASEIAYARGFKLAPLVESSLAQSFKLSSSFLARSTSAFIAYDLYRSVKELRNGTSEALVGVVGDSVYLGVDAAELSIEVAEGFGVLEEVSSVTGPIGTTIGAVVFVGTDVYQAVKKTENIDRLVHLTAGERVLEGIRAFVGIKPEMYIEELIEEEQSYNQLVYNQLVKQALEYLKQHNDIQRYVFPTGKLVQDTCSMVQYKEQCPSPADLVVDLMAVQNEPTGLDIRSACNIDKNGNLFILKEREECTTKFQHDSDNTVILDKQKPDIRWSKIRPDNPPEGTLFCIPQGYGQLAPGLAYSCKNAIGVEYVNNRTSNYTLLDLGDGTDYARGFKDSNNIFFIGNGNKTISGGEKDDTFILQGNRFEGKISGGNGTNTLDLSKFSPQSKSLFLSFRGNNLPTLGGLIDQISKVITRENKEDIISCKDVTLKYIDGRGGRNENEQDVITIEFDYCQKLFGTTIDCRDYLSGKFIPKVQIMLRDYTTVNNYASKGNFSYFVDQKEGKTSVNILSTSKLSTSKNDFIFNNTLENIKAINFNSNDVRTVRFTFSPHNTEALISYRVQNISFTLKDGTVISVSKEGNLYALQNSNKSVDEIINSYSRVANNLKMSIFVHSLLNNESIVVGHGKHDVIENNPQYKSHLVGNGGENIFVVTSDKLPIPEIVLYDVDQENKIDTLDLRKIRKQVESNLNVKVKTRVITSGKDLIIQLFYEKDNEVSESNIGQVRLKNGLLTNWYERLHVIMNHVAMKIEEFELRPLPLVFDNNEEIIRIAAEDVDKNNKIIISQKIEDYTFSKLGNDLIMTFNNNASLILSEFYKNKEMETLTIRFANKEVAIKDELSNIKSFDDLKEEYKNSTASIINSFNSTEAKLEPSKNDTINRRNKRAVESNVKSAASRPTSFINTIASTVTTAMMSVIQGVSQFISAKKHSSAHMSSQPVQMGDPNSTLLLLDVFIRKITGEKYISLAEQSISPSKARDYALSITDSFEKVLAKSSGCAIPKDKLDFDWFNKLFRSIEGSMISGQYSKVPRILHESAKNICSNPSEKFFSDVERNIEKMLNDMVKENSLSLEKRSTINNSTPLSSLSKIDIEPVSRRRAIG